MGARRKSEVKTMFGHCFSATLVSDGSLRSSTSAEAFHAKCPGVLANTGRTPMRCECSCHSVVRASSVVADAAPADAGVTAGTTSAGNGAGARTATAVATARPTPKATATINRKRRRGVAS